jgi:pantetheine-phosphate adenylyltransferase
MSEKKIRRAVYAGTFDPITNGHLDVILRAAKIFDEIIVGVADAVHKKTLFTPAERLKLVREVTKDIPNVKAEIFKTLLVDWAKEKKAVAVVRGLRAMTDFEFEFQMALTNRRLDEKLEAVFLMTREDLAYISSTNVKEIALLGGDVKEMVPPQAARALYKKFARKR